MQPTDSLESLRAELASWRARHAGGTVGKSDFDRARRPLEQRIVDLVMAGAWPGAGALAAPQPPAIKVPARLWLGTAAFALVVAAGGYAWKGSPGLQSPPPSGFADAGAAAGPDGAASANHQISREQIEALVARLAARLEKNPDDADGWVMLGRSYVAFGRNGEAVQAYRKALALRPDDAGILADTADALGTSLGGKLDGEPAQLIERALRADPNDLKALALAGTLAYNRGDDAGAVKHWDRAVQRGPADHPLVAVARDGAAQARERSKLPPATGGPSGAPTAAAMPGAPSAALLPPAGNAAAQAAQAAPVSPAAAAATAIRGTVKLSAQLKERAAPEDTVFIFARPAGGGMPLALMRKQVRELPAEFTLDDTQAMTPTARLSGAQRVMVTARISKSGQAMPAAGDLEGQSAEVAPGAQGVVVEISKVRP